MTYEEPFIISKDTLGAHMTTTLNSRYKTKALEEHWNSLNMPFFFFLNTHRFWNSKNEQAMNEQLIHNM